MVGVGPFGDTAIDALERDGGCDDGLQYKRLDRKLPVLPQFLEDCVLLKQSNFGTRRVQIESMSIRMTQRVSTVGFLFLKHINTLQWLQQEVLATKKTIKSKDMMITLSPHLPRTYSEFLSSLTTSGRADTIIWAELVPMEIDEEDQDCCSGSSKSSVSFAGIESLGEKKNKGERHIWFGEADIFDED